MHANPMFDSACIQAFAKVSASISHEIKNTMAIINENAGLLDDLVVMGGGEGVSSERVKAAADTIARQVVRTNTMMNHLNRFAHTADHDTGQENLQDILSLIVPLTARQAAAKNLEISMQCPENIQINTHLLPFHALLYLTLRLLIDHSDDGDKISMQGDLQDGIISVCYTAPCISDAIMTSFSADLMPGLLAKLKANSSHDDNRLCLSCPSVSEEEG